MISSSLSIGQIYAILRSISLRGAEPTQAQPCTPKELCQLRLRKGLWSSYTTPLVWSESNDAGAGARGVQSLAPRSRYSIRPLTFECDPLLPNSSLKRVLGLRNRSRSFVWAQLSTRPVQCSNLAVCLRAGPEAKPLGTAA